MLVSRYYSQPFLAALQSVLCLNSKSGDNLDLKGYMFTKKASVEELSLDIDRLKEKFKYEIKYLRQYLGFTSDSVDEKQEQLAKTIFEDSQSDPDNEAYLQDLYSKEIKAISSYYHHSSIVLIYTVLESSLSQLCHEVTEMTKSKFTHERLAGKNLIGKSIDYLQLTSSLDFTKIEGVWAKIGRYQGIRNQIVHQNSRLKKDKTGSTAAEQEKLKKLFKDIEFSSDGDRFYILDKKIVIEFLDSTEKLMNVLYQEIECKTFLVPVVYADDEISDELPF